MVCGDSVSAIELTCCFELNTKKARDYKATQYQELEKQMKSNKSLKLILAEITTLGIVTRDIRMFESFLNDLGLNSDRTIIIKCMEVCIRASFCIYCTNLTWNKSPKDTKVCANKIAFSHLDSSLSITQHISYRFPHTHM